MSLTATDFDFSKPGKSRDKDAGPAIDERPWGYAIHDQTRHPGLRATTSKVSRFMGVLSIFVLATVLVTPDDGASTTAFLIKVVLLFALGIGAALFTRAGQQANHPDFHIDTRSNEIRVGRHDLKGQFTLTARLSFKDVQSVYLLRSKERERPARLFLRLDDAGNAIEVASGPERDLDRLRGRLAQDLVRERPAPATNRAAPVRKVFPRRVTV